MDVENVVKTNPLIPKADIYADIASSSQEVTRAYHVAYLPDGRKIYTDMPEISELKSKIIKGVTDTIIYYVNRYDDPLTLRPITSDKAKYIFGDNYQDQILYFDDSIVYSYKIGQP